MAIGPALPDTSLVLDNDVLNDWRFQKLYVQRAIDDYISRLKRPPALTSMTVFEALYGFENKAFKSGKLDQRIEQDRDKTIQLINSCTVLSWDQTAAQITAYIYPRLSQSERNKHWRDLFIATTAIAHGHGVATRNQSDFELIAKHLPPSHPLLRLAIWKP